jgi:voltage-gated potassium channel
MMSQSIPDQTAPWRKKLHDVIFLADTPAGKAFDVVLIVAIILSVIVVMLDTVESYSARYGEILIALEWIFTGLFTVEYVLRLLTAPSAGRYARSFYGLVDLSAVLPSYLSLLFPAGRFLLVVRGLRVLRVFRVLKLVEYVGEAAVLGRALRASRVKITVFLVSVLTVVLIVGAAMYLVEGPESGFTSIPRAAYWAIVTLTTVGYGDIAPQSSVGQALASLVMILGYGIIAVPTGIVTVELGRAAEHRPRPSAGAPTGGSGPTCGRCGMDGHLPDSRFCRGCGERLGG